MTSQPSAVGQDGLISSRSCQFCPNTQLDTETVITFGERICRHCKSVRSDYQGIVKSKAKKEFLLSDKWFDLLLTIDFQSIPFRPSLIRAPSWRKPSPYLIKPLFKFQGIPGLSTLLAHLPLSQTWLSNKKIIINSVLILCYSLSLML